MWIDRVGPLRVPEQLSQGRDPVQRRVDGVLGPPGQDRLLELQPVLRVQRVLRAGGHSIGGGGGHPGSLLAAGR